MKFEIILNTGMNENTYLLYDENTKNAVIIDPGAQMTKIESKTNELGVNIKYILLTHCHYDHITSVKEIKDKTGAKIVMGENGPKNVADPDINLSVMGLGYEISGIDVYKTLSDGENLTIDSMEIKCIYTPGHTDCGVCYLCENKLFSGDTLFLRSCGRWDFPGGDYKNLKNSVKEKLFALPEDTEVYPGHGGATTIGYEKKFNMIIN